MSVLTEIANALRQMAQQATAGDYVVLGNRFAQAADLIADIDSAGAGLEGLPPDQNEEIRDLLNIGVSFGATEYLAFRAGATAIALANPVTGLVLFVGFLVFEEALESTLQFLHQEWGITLVGESIDYSVIDRPMEILGTIVDDVFVSTVHNDTIQGLAGDDILSNAGGSDQVFGGSGHDTIDYSAMAFSSANGIVLDATAGDGTFVVHHHSDTDVVESIEAIIGTSVADAFLLGNYGANIAGGGHIESIDAGAGDDVALLLNEGGAGPRRVAIDGGAGIDVIDIVSDGFNTEINFANGTVRYQGGANAQFAIANFEAARGGDGSDVMLGSDNVEYLLGNEGADRLFGGGADDFIFFDAEDCQHGRAGA
jgi:Ca2+-binding RTX toxin-like protein